MDRYVNSDAILNYIANPVIEEKGDDWAIDKALFALRNYSYRNRAPYDYKYIIKEYKDYTFQVNDPNIMRVWRVFHYTTCPYHTSNIDPDAEVTSTPADSATDKVVRLYNFAADTDDVLIIQQASAWMWADYIASGCELRYRGQYKKLIECFPHETSCTGYYSVDDTLQWIRPSQEKGYLGVIYRTLKKDENNKTIVPQDEKLLKGCGMYAEAEYWNERVFAQPRLHSLYVDKLSMAMNMLRESRGSKAMRTLDPKKLFSVVNEKFPLRSDPAVSGNYRNRQYLY